MPSVPPNLVLDERRRRVVRLLATAALRAAQATPADQVDPTVEPPTPPSPETAEGLEPQPEWTDGGAPAAPTWAHEATSVNDDETDPSGR